MEQNTVVVMLDDEISRLRQVRTILQSLVVIEARVKPLLVAAAEEPDIREEEEELAQAPEPVRHVSRRGIKTGRRGPRPKQTVPPRPLDAAVPKAPVVVSRSAIVERKPAATPTPDAVVEGTLESWVRSFKQSQVSA